MPSHGHTSHTAKSKLEKMIDLRSRLLAAVSGKAPPAIQTSPQLRPAGHYAQRLEALETECPEYVPVERWQQAVEDARRFVAEWSDQAAALGWIADDLFGLAPIPDKPKPAFERLSRYDQTGLCWLLHGRRVIALTEITAVIETETGTLAYRRYHKPALCPLGDSLDDFPLGGGTGQ